MEILTQLSIYFLWFLIYSFIGWLWEILLFSVTEKKFVNRGFLHGPYCPIYGCGALINLIFFTYIIPINDVVTLFVVGTITTTILEYSTSWFMEKFFHSRWWTYDDWPLNINGRVCLPASLGFGFMIVLLMRVIHPAIKDLTQFLPSTLIIVSAIILFLLFLFDVIYTVIEMKIFNKKLAQIQKQINDTLQEFKSKTSPSSNNTLAEQLHRITSHLNTQERKIINSLDFRSTKFQGALKKLQENFAEKKSAQ